MMTPHQLHLLDALGDATSDRRPGPAQREAVRAILAEREQALEHISDLASLLEMDPEYTPGTDAYTAGEVAKLFIARANGGP